MSPSTAPPTVAEPPVLLDVQAVAQLLGCSTRHVYRLADAGRMPASRRLGRLIRWSRLELLDWIGGGCRPVRRG
jgi:excisionase family DNA binding protein